MAYINTGGKVLGLGARHATLLGDAYDDLTDLTEFDPERDYSPPVEGPLPFNPIVAPVNMPDWNPYAGIGLGGGPNTAPPPYIPTTPKNDYGDPGFPASSGPDKVIINTPPGATSWLGGIVNPFVKALLPLGTSAATRAILGSTAVVNPNTGLPVLSANTGQPLYANSSGVISTIPGGGRPLSAYTPLLIGAGVIALVLILKKK